MRRHLIVMIVTLSVAALGAGCSKKAKPSVVPVAPTVSQPQDPQAGATTETAPATAPTTAAEQPWSLTLKSECAQTAQDQCVGKYGFSVTQEGKYQVGPGPKGQIKNGQLTEGEFSDLKTKLQQALTTIPTGDHPTENHTGGVINDNDESISLSRSGQDKVLARNTGSDFYFLTPQPKESQDVQNAIREIAKIYYRLPFGNDCGDSIDKVEKLYDPALTCQADSDCLYVDPERGYEVIPPGSEEWIFTEDCRLIKPLLVANKTQILSAAQGLIEAYDLATQSCGADFYRSECTYDQKPTTNPPVCVQNRCQTRF
ncbi:hypothetical protein WDW37_06120 [Bdellovibrionota bacterium FG-1]